MAEYNSQQIHGQNNPNAEQSTNVKEFSVSEIAGDLKRVVEDAFGQVRVRGEISGYRGPHASGHAYFALKDDKAKLEAVIWRGSIAKLKFQPEEGMEVIAHGKLTTYPNSSKYQLIIEKLEPAGVGALMAQYEERKKRLAAEGLFDKEHKQVLPFMPKIIGVVTSPTGDVIRDIIHRIEDRFPLHIVVWPVRVQGETCAIEVSAAIKGFNLLAEKGRLKPDILIVARGGGSLEDLWGFNDEMIVRAVAASKLPIISAIGHEPDVTLIDYVADVRAPTPTGAAEIAVPVKIELVAKVATLYHRLRQAVLRYFEFCQQRHQSLSRSLLTPDQILALPRQRFDEASTRLHRSLNVLSQRKRQEFNASNRLLSKNLVVNLIERHHQKQQLLALRFIQNYKNFLSQKRQILVMNNRVLATLSYQNTLNRGFALILNDNNSLVKNASQLPDNGKIQIKFSDTIVAANIVQSEEEEKNKTKPKILAKNKVKKKPKDNEQGSLF